MKFTHKHIRDDTVRLKRHRIRDVWNPLSIRERMVYGGLFLAILVLFLGPITSADNGDIGEYYLVPATKCQSVNGWLDPQNAASLHETNTTTQINIANASQGINGNDPLICKKFNKTKGHIIYRPALEINIAIVNELPPSSATSEYTPVSSSMIKLDSRKNVELPNALNDPQGYSLDTIASVRLSADNGETWQILHTFSSDLASKETGIVRLAIPKEYARNINKLQVQINLENVSDDQFVLVESVGFSYEVGSGKELSAFILDNKGEKLGKKVPVINQGRLVFQVLGKDPSEGLWEGLSNKIVSNIVNESEPELEVKAEITNENDEVVAALDVDVEWQGTDFQNEDEWTIESTGMPEDLKPGKYTLNLEFTNDAGSTQFLKQDFIWGVLAFNTNKSIYEVGNRGHFGVTVLDENGSTICDADITINISRNSLEIQELSTGNKLVTISKSCEEYGDQIEPDYKTTYLFNLIGEFDIEVTAVTDNGTFSVSDSILVVENSPIDVERIGPTRLFPIVDYAMSINIVSDEDRVVTITERVPNSFKIKKIDDAINFSLTERIQFNELVWSLFLQKDVKYELRYLFDAPDVSPAFYTLDPLIITDQSDNKLFEEFRQWQLAGDAIGHMLLLFDGPTIPSGWSCISCTGGDAFYQKFIRGNATYGGTGGSANHTHTLSSSLDVTSSANTLDEKNGTGIINNVHVHSYTPTVAAANNLPSYRQLKVIRYDTSGEPSTLPTGVIGFFDDTEPSGWTRYSTQDAKYIFGEGTVGTTGGTDSHTVGVTGTTGAATSGAIKDPKNTGGFAATATHTHTVSLTSGSDNQEPPFIQTILAKLDSAAAPPADLITMWDDTPPTNYDSISDASEPFNAVFIKPAATYGTTGGGANHSHSNFSGNSSAASASSATNDTKFVMVASSHVHNIDITNVSSESNLPPYSDAIFAKKLVGTTFQQSVYRWFDNVDSTDVGSALADEDLAATLTTDGQLFRLRMGIHIGLNNLASSGQDFKLQYAVQSGTCDTGFVGETYTDVSPSSGAIRYYDNPTPTDGSALTTNTGDPTHSTDTMQAQTYEESNIFTNSQSAINVGQDGVWDFVLEDFSADFDVTYCFRAVESDTTEFLSYSVIPQITTSPPPARMILLFDGGTIPTGWSCVSCTGGDDAYQKFLRGEATYGGTGGNANHTPTATVSVPASGAIGTGQLEGAGTGMIATNHTHTLSPTFGSGNNLPSYRQLKVIRYDAGSPTTIPSGAIAYFSTSTMPTNWTRYSAQDNYYIRGEGTAGTTGGSNTHFHTISGTTSLGSGTIEAPRAGTNEGIATDTHLHTVSGSSDSLNNEPTYIALVLGKADQDVSIPTSNFIVMWDKTPPGGWNCVSCMSGDAVYQKFAKADSIYGGTGGGATHVHANQNVTSSAPTITSTSKVGTDTSSDTHTHSVSITSYSTDNHLPPYLNIIFASKGVNNAPNSPTSLDQLRVSAGTSIAVDDWTNETQVKFTANASDTDNPDDLKLCVEAEPTGTAFNDVATGCGSLVSYTGTAVAVEVTLTGLIAEVDYHWQAQIVDAGAAGSSWVSFGGNAESARDFAIDITGPTGTVYDGSTPAVDIDINSGSLSSLSGNWVINSALSGLDGYEYSIGTTVGGTDVKGWTDVGTSASATASSLNLRTSQIYFFNVRTTDNAANQSIITSDGILVAPTISFSVAPSGVVFNNLNVGNSFNDSQTSTLTTSTNAYNGYVIKVFATGSLTNQFSDTIDFFDGGTYAAPDGWLIDDRGFGYTSSDNTIQGVDLFNPATCIGGNSSPCYVPFSTTKPGDIAADHTDLVTGTPISNENFTITHQVKADSTQAPGAYTSEIVFSVIPTY